MLLMERSTHRNSQRLCLFAAGYDASVVVGQNHNRNADQRRIKDPLARAEEIVAINEGEAGHDSDLHNPVQFGNWNENMPGFPRGFQ